jgi:hypothetical protein
MGGWVDGWMGELGWNFSLHISSFYVFLLGLLNLATSFFSSVKRLIIVFIQVWIGFAPGFLPPLFQFWFPTLGDFGFDEFSWIANENSSKNS